MQDEGEYILINQDKYRNLKTQLEENNKISKINTVMLTCSVVFLFVNVLMLMLFRTH